MRAKIDEALAAELERAGTPPARIVERPLAEGPAHSPRRIPEALGQIVLVLQGGGALGAYQVGVYRALHEASVEPDWVIGTSIGAINASLIAGNAPESRLEKMDEFWRRMRHDPWLDQLGAIPVFGQAAANLVTIAAGLPAFF